MAGSNKRRGQHGRPGRVMLALLGLIVVLAGIIAAQVQWADDAKWTPRLGLDLEGGTQIVLEPVVQGGGKVTSQTLRQSVDIIRARINGSGVGEAEITTQGGRNIVVAVPGKISDEQRELIKQSSQLRFRPVLAAAPVQAPAPTSSPTSTGTPTGPAVTPTSGTTASGGATPGASPTTSTDKRGLPQALLRGGTTTPTTPTTPTPSATATPTASGGSTPSPTPTNASDPAWITPALEKEFVELNCSDTSKIQGGTDDPDKPLVTCSQDRDEKYILGPVEISGTDIKDATAGLQPTQNGGTSTTWEVRLAFNDAGAKKFLDVTTRLYTLPEPRNRFGIVLDGLVISAPSANEPIAGGSASIYGNFTQKSSLALANQLKYGALPLSFKVQTEEQISPLLGAEQLQRGLLAGLIGMGLVVLYSLAQYRALGFVTVSSLIVAAIVTMEMVVLLGNSAGLRLTLAGVTGLIVSIGVTADSFIVYFERVRDEVREGRSLRAAVETGWRRARRTILAADAINFLAAAVLYVLAAGGVRGFAYMLGLATLIDVVIVFLFTHPLLTLLARTKFFGQGHKLSGLDPEHLGSGITLGVKANIGTIASRRAAAAASSRSGGGTGEA